MSNSSSNPAVFRSLGICFSGLTELMEKNFSAGRLTYTLDKQAAYRDAEMIFICVGTPSDERGDTDLSYIDGAADDIAVVIKARPPGTEASSTRPDASGRSRTSDQASPASHSK